MPSTQVHIILFNPHTGWSIRKLAAKFSNFTTSFQTLSLENLAVHLQKSGIKDPTTPQMIRYTSLSCLVSISIQKLTFIFHTCSDLLALWPLSLLWVVNFPFKMPCFVWAKNKADHSVSLGCTSIRQYTGFVLWHKLTTNHTNSSRIGLPTLFRKKTLKL